MWRCSGPLESSVNSGRRLYRGHQRPEHTSVSGALPLRVPCGRASGPQRDRRPGGPLLARLLLLPCPAFVLVLSLSSSAEQRVCCTETPTASSVHTSVSKGHRGLPGLITACGA